MALIQKYCRSNQWKVSAACLRKDYGKYVGKSFRTDTAFPGIGVFAI